MGKMLQKQWNININNLIRECQSGKKNHFLHFIHVLKIEIISLVTNRIFELQFYQIPTICIPPLAWLGTTIPIVFFPFFFFLLILNSSHYFHTFLYITDTFTLSRLIFCIFYVLAGNIKKLGIWTLPSTHMHLHNHRSPVALFACNIQPPTRDVLEET